MNEIRIATGQVILKDGTYHCLTCKNEKVLRQGDIAPQCTGKTHVRDNRGDQLERRTVWTLVTEDQ